MPRRFVRNRRSRWSGRGRRGRRRRQTFRTGSTTTASTERVVIVVVAALFDRLRAIVGRWKNRAMASRSRRWRHRCIGLGRWSHRVAVVVVVVVAATTTIGSFQRGDAPLDGAHRRALLLFLLFPVKIRIVPTLRRIATAGCATIPHATGKRAPAIVRPMRTTRPTTQKTANGQKLWLYPPTNLLP
jgi:hypothetical protein